MRLHAERAARGDDFRPRVPWVQSSLGDPRSVKPSSYLAGSPRARRRLLKNKSGSIQTSRRPPTGTTRFRLPPAAFCSATAFCCPRSPPPKL